MTHGDTCSWHSSFSLSLQESNNQSELIKTPHKTHRIFNLNKMVYFGENNLYCIKKELNCASSTFVKILINLKYVNESNWVYNKMCEKSREYLTGIKSVAKTVTKWSTSGLPQHCWCTPPGGTTCMRLLAHLPTPAGQRRTWLRMKRWSSRVATLSRVDTFNREWHCHASLWGQSSCLSGIKSLPQVDIPKTHFTCTGVYRWLVQDSE